MGKIDRLIDAYLQTKETIVIPNVKRTLFSNGNTGAVPPIWMPWDIVLFPIALFIQWLRRNKDATD